MGIIPPPYYMKKYRCVKTNFVSQGYGIKNTAPSLLPLYNKYNLVAHNGIDYAVSCQDNSAKKGGLCESVYYDVDCAGEVVFIELNESFGLRIDIITESNGEIFKHRWCHFDSINPTLKVGDTIETGYLLGIAGNTGVSTGAHVHTDIKKLEKDVYGNYYEKEPLNGYGGCCDPTPYLDNRFVLDVLDNLKAQIGVLQKMIEAYNKILELFKIKVG